MKNELVESVEFVKFINSFIQDAVDKGTKIFDADNRDYYISEFKFCPIDNKIIFEIEEDKDKTLNPYDTIIKLAAENSDLKLEVTELKEQIETLIKVCGGNGKVIEALNNHIISTIELEEGHNGKNQISNTAATE